jgi:hypothetical protein
MRPTGDKADLKVTTDEVGNEGGSPGDVEVARDPVPATGSEAGETWRPRKDDLETIERDETGEGRRSP